MSRLSSLTSSQELALFQTNAAQEWDRLSKTNNIDKLLNLTNQLSLVHFHEMGRTDQDFVRGYEDQHEQMINQTQELQKKRMVCALSVAAGAANIIGGVIGLGAGVKCAAAGATKAALKVMKAGQAVSTGITSIGGGLQAIQKPFEDSTQRNLTLVNSQTEIVKTKTEHSRSQKRKHDDLVSAQRQALDKQLANEADAKRAMVN